MQDSDRIKYTKRDCKKQLHLLKRKKNIFLKGIGIFTIIFLFFYKNIFPSSSLNMHMIKSQDKFLTLHIYIAEERAVFFS